MEIKPCPKSKDGKHEWRYAKRNHGNKNRRFVYCLKCPQTAQESSNGRKFTTAREFENKKTVTGSYRVSAARETEILKADYKSLNQYLNISPVIQLQYKP